MPRKEILKPYKKGDILTAKRLNQMVHEVSRLSSTGFGGAINGISNSAGTFMAVNQPRTRIEGYLDSDLAASSCAGQEETTATMSVYSGNGDNWKDTDRDVTITNRDDTLSLTSGIYVRAEKYGTEWRIYYAGCEEPSTSGASC